MAALILLIHPAAMELERMQGALQRAGYVVETATTFVEGKTRLAESPPPELLIAAVRLGAFNGLHLVIHAHARNPATMAVVTTPLPDPAVEAEAGALGAGCAVAPWNDESELLSLAARLTQPV